MKRGAVPFKLTFGPPQQLGGHSDFKCEIAGFPMPNINELKVDVPVDGVAVVKLGVVLDGDMELEFPALVNVNLSALDGTIIREERNGKTYYTVVRQKRLPETS